MQFGNPLVFGRQMQAVDVLCGDQECGEPIGLLPLGEDAVSGVGRGGGEVINGRADASQAADGADLFGTTEGRRGSGREGGTRRWGQEVEKVC